MPASKYSHVDVKPLPSNVMELRDEAFYGFVRQFSGKRVAELLAFQELNGVDSFLGCKDVSAILNLESDQLNDLKKTTCIALKDGTVALLPGLESSINILGRILKKKRDEINKQAERLQSINPSILSAVNTIPTVLPTAPVPTSQSSINTPSSLATSTADSSDSSTLNFSNGLNPLNDETTNRISTSIIDWLKKNQHELNLMNIDFRQGIDFHIELNKRRNGVIMRCKCDTKLAISQSQGVLVFSNIFRHFKSEKCSMINDKKKNSTDHHSSDNSQENDRDPPLMITTQSTSSTSHQSKSCSVKPTSSKVNNRTRSTSNTSKRKRQRLK